MTHTYVALIGDAIASRELPAPRRARLQRALRAALPTFNRRWRTTLAARFALTLGDEFQCLLTGPAALWEIAHAVRSELADVDWAFACGRGPVTTPLTPGITAPEVDAPWPPAGSASTAAPSPTWAAAWPGLWSRRAILSSQTFSAAPAPGPRGSSGESTDTRPVARLHPRRHAVARADRRPPPGAGAAPR